MDEPLQEALLGLYQNLKGAFVGGSHRYVRGSIYLGLMEMRSKTRRMRVLLDASLGGNALGSLGGELVGQGLAVYAGADRRITLSAKGIRTAEQIKGVLDLDGLLSYMDNKWLSLFDEVGGAPNDKERLVLFALLAARSFSPETGANMTRKETFGAWTELLISSSAFLKERGFSQELELTAILSTSNVGPGLHPLRNFFRYTENLPRKTDGIYVASANVYYLGLLADGAIDKTKLAFLFRLVLEDRADFAMIGEIGDFCRDRAYDTAVKVLPLGHQSFASQEIDRLIVDALRECVLGA